MMKFSLRKLLLFFVFLSVMFAAIMYGSNHLSVMLHYDPTPSFYSPTTYGLDMQPNRKYFYVLLMWNEKTLLRAHTKQPGGEWEVNFDDKWKNPPRYFRD